VTEGRSVIYSHVHNPWSKSSENYWQVSMYWTAVAWWQEYQEQVLDEEQ